MTNSKTQRPARHGSFRDTPASPPPVKKEHLPPAPKEPEARRAGERHHAAKCHKSAGSGKLSGGE